MLLAAQKAVADRLEAAEQKAARLEEMVARQIDEKAGLAKEMIRWQDTVKLRDEAIERKEQRIKELMEQLQRAASQVVDQAKELDDLRAQIGIEWGDGGFLPPGKTFREVLGAEVEARKKVLDENARLMGKLQEATDQNIELLNQVDRLARKDPQVDKLKSDLDHAVEANAAWAKRVKEVEKELAEYQVAEPNPYHKETISVTLTLGQIAEFVRLFKPGEAG